MFLQIALMSLTKSNVLSLTFFFNDYGSVVFDTDIDVCLSFFFFSFRTGMIFESISEICLESFLSFGTVEFISLNFLVDVEIFVLS